jgi:hypothetical protein
MISLAATLGIEASIIGRVEKSVGKQIFMVTPEETIIYKY